MSLCLTCSLDSVAPSSGNSNALSQVPPDPTDERALRTPPSPPLFVDRADEPRPRLMDLWAVALVSRAANRARLTLSPLDVMLSERLPSAPLTPSTPPKSPPPLEFDRGRSPVMGVPFTPLDMSDGGEDAPLRCLDPSRLPWLSRLPRLPAPVPMLLPEGSLPADDGRGVDDDCPLLEEQCRSPRISHTTRRWYNEFTTSAACDALWYGLCRSYPLATASMNR